MKKHNTKRNSLVLNTLGATILLTGLTPHIATANAVDDAADACIEAARLIREEDDINGAIEEAQWCLEGMTQLKEEIKLSLLPDEIEGFVGGEISNQNVLGMSVIERDYTRDDEALKLSITTSGSGGSGAAGLGALGELGKLFESAGTLGGSSTGRKVRVQKRTVLASDDAGEGSLNVTLKSGGTLNITSQQLDSEELLDFLRAFPLADLDDALED